MNKPNMFVVTSACDSNLRYSLEDKKKMFISCPPKLSLHFMEFASGKSIKPSTLQLFDRWLREGGNRREKLCVLKISSLVYLDGLALC